MSLEQVTGYPLSAAVMAGCGFDSRSSSDGWSQLPGASGMNPEGWES